MMSLNIKIIKNLLNTLVFSSYKDGISDFEVGVVTHRNGDVGVNIDVILDYNTYHSTESFRDDVREGEIERRIISVMEYLSPERTSVEFYVEDKWKKMWTPSGYNK